MKTKTVLFIILGIFFSILGFDLYLYSDGVPGNSITQTIIEYSQKSALIPWFIGMIMGFLGAHFFDSYKEPRKTAYRELTSDENAWLSEFASANLALQKVTADAYNAITQQADVDLKRKRMYEPVNIPKSTITGWLKEYRGDLLTKDESTTPLRIVTAWEGETKDPEKKDE